MPESAAQQFLRDLDKKLWGAADRLRASLDVAVYKHAVLGLIFLKYVSDSFAVRQKEIEAQVRGPKIDYFLDPEDYKKPVTHEAAIHAELEERDYYLEKNVFWVPALAWWKTLHGSAKLPAGSVIEVTNGKKTSYKLVSTGKLIDDALDAIEKENPQFKGVFNKTYTQLQLDLANLSSLVDLIATMPFGSRPHLRGGFTAATSLSCSSSLCLAPPESSGRSSICCATIRAQAGTRHSLETDRPDSSIAL